MCFRKAAGVVVLLQRLTEIQIAPHSRFAAVRGFPAGPLALRTREMRTTMPE